MKKIPLNKGMFAIVDAEDFDFISSYNWSYINGYAVSNIGYKTSYMHRILNKTPDCFQTDHINGNKLDNRKSNLRQANFSQNNCNKSKTSNNSSGYKGVSWHKKSEKWRADIKINKKQTSLGLFNCKETAAVAYNKKALELHGSFARLNDIAEAV
jgi:hypothetical protein